MFRVRAVAKALASVIFRLGIGLELGIGLGLV